MKSIEETRIGVVGLGYVGLPLTLAFADHYQVVGFDINESRVDQLKKGIDETGEADKEEIFGAESVVFSNDRAQLKGCDVYVITVPTPVDASKRPDLTPLQAASAMVGECLQEGDVVIYESTVFPGCTEEICVPILEQKSGLQFNRDFFAGYSPERINPGDKDRDVRSILKVTSGSNQEVAEFVDSLYGRVITAGTYLASSIKVAEACKVIENVQRDTNIALVNELALIFQRLEINTEEVLKAAGTKWNFLPFRPGLVGGHCIGVDPYYLVHRAEAAGYYPEVISASRRLNDSMGELVANHVMRVMTLNRIHIVGSNILILGLAFKENCPDLRNTRVVDIYRELDACNANVDIYDPWVDVEQARQEFNVDLVTELPAGKYDAVIVAVAHNEFIEMGVDAVRGLMRSDSVLYDIKHVFPHDKVDARL